MNFSSRPRTFDAPLSLSEFQRPGSRFGLAPFWFWNCGMDEHLVKEQVRAMKAANVGGFFIHPRQGMTTPYLSDEFFARVRAAVEVAAELGMEAWLYDEFPYPSGIAGGLLTAQNPELRARVLKHFEREASGGEEVSWQLPLGRVICALAVPLENGAPDWSGALDVRSALGVVLTREELWIWPMGHIPYNEKRFMADEGALVLRWTAPKSGNWKLIVAVESEQRGHKYFDCWFDPLHPGAAPKFLELTHERYKRAVGDWFGTTIPGIFSDEIEPPHWSPQLERALPLDWSRMAPALWDESFPDSRSIRLKWRELSLALFKDSWETPVARWCEANRLVWCAEKPTYRPQQMALVEQPATDAGHRRVDLGPERLPLQLRANGRAAMSVAEQNGGSEVRCECFHSLGWGATLQDQKWSIDWLAATGVNRWTPHAFYSSSSGLRKFDAAPSFFEENPYWPHFGLLGDYAARLGLAVSRGREVAPIALLYPTKRLWRREREDETRFVELQNALLEGHFGFHILDAPALELASAQNGSLSVGRARYETLLVPPFDNGDEEIEVFLENAIASGMRVYEVTGAGEALALLEPLRALSVCDSEGRELPNVWSTWRQTPGDDAQNIVFLANTSAESVSANVRVRCDSTRWELWSLEDGTTSPIAISDGDSFQIELPAFGSSLLIGQNGAAPEALPATPKRVLTFDVSGDWGLSRDEPNALRLNRWRIAPSSVVAKEMVAAPDFDDLGWREVEAMPLFHRDQRVRREVELLPRESGEAVWYRRTIESEIRPDDIALLIEDGAIGGSWTMWLNGEEMSRDRFAPMALHGRDKTACSLASHWREGANSLVIRVEEGDQHCERGGLRVPIHLVGHFGVAGSPNGARVLTAPLESAPFNDLEVAQLPHFAGTARFSKRFPAGMFANFDALALPDGFEDIATLRFDDREAEVRAWSPYEWTIPSFDVPEVEVEIAVTNTLLRFLEGRVWNARSGERGNV